MARLPLALVAIAACAVLAGCARPSFTSQSAHQQDLVGPVRVTTAIEGCENSLVTPPDCGGSTHTQILLGFRIPASATAPDTFSTVTGVPASFHKSTSYTGELERLAPAAAGEVWVGYISDELHIPATTGDVQRGTVEPEFGLPAGAGGAPFTYASVVGFRDNTSLGDPGRAVVCDATDLFNQSDSNSTECVTAPANFDADTAVPVNDLRLSAGDTFAHPGDTATVPFVARLSGPPLAAGAFAMSVGAGSLAGAAGTPATATLVPAPGDSPTFATVNVPATAVPGDYPITLTATNGTQTRSATGTLHVLGVPPNAAGLRGRSFRVSKGGVVSILLICPSSAIDPCAGSVSLASAGKVTVAKRKKARKVLKLGSGKFDVAPGKTGSADVKLTATARRTLASIGKLKAKATFTTKNRAGDITKNVQTLTLLPPKARKRR
jgi:hypothetical protein